MKPEVPAAAILMWGGDPADMAAPRTVEALDAMREYAQTQLEFAYLRAEEVEKAVYRRSDYARLRVVRAARHRLVHMVLARAVAIPKLAGILEAWAAEVRADPGLEQLAVELERCARNVRATFIDDSAMPPPEPGTSGMRPGGGR